MYTANWYSNIEFHMNKVNEILFDIYKYYLLWISREIIHAFKYALFCALLIT